MQHVMGFRFADEFVAMNDRAKATGNMYRKFREIKTYGSAVLD